MAVHDRTRLTDGLKSFYLAVSNQIEPALKLYFPRLRAFAPLLYVDTAAVATAQIHRKIPILRCYAVFTSENDLKWKDLREGIPSVLQAEILHSFGGFRRQNLV